MTYEEHVTRAMLFGGVFYPAYNLYHVNNTWVCADTLEALDYDTEVLPRYMRYAKHPAAHSAVKEGIPPTDRWWFQWREWT